MDLTPRQRLPTHVLGVIRSPFQLNLFQDLENSKSKVEKWTYEQQSACVDLTTKFDAFDRSYLFSSSVMRCTTQPASRSAT